MSAKKLKLYADYIKDNPKNYWFKRKIFGWGWFPAKWQGWLVILIFLWFVFYITNIFLNKGRTLEYSVLLTIAVVILIYIGYKKGEKARWQWGLKRK